MDSWMNKDVTLSKGLWIETLESSDKNKKSIKNKKKTETIELTQIYIIVIVIHTIGKKSGSGRSNRNSDICK